MDERSCVSEDLRVSFRLLKFEICRFCLFLRNVDLLRTVFKIYWLILRVNMVAVVTRFIAYIA